MRSLTARVVLALCLSSVFALLLPGLKAQLLTVLNAQAAKTDRQLLTEALATITAIRDRMPADPTNPPTLVCAPSSQSVITSSSASLRASGGTGTYAWSATDGTPAAGDAAAFSTSYGTVGSKTVSVTSGTQTATCQVAVATTPTPTPTGNLLFSSGWESALGCGPQLLDGVWADYGGSDACSGSVRDVDIVADVHHDGAHSLRVTQKPGKQNGTDFRLVSPPFGNRSELTAIVWVFFDAAYHWANADHKLLLLMGGNSPNLYVNFRGGSDPQHARLCMYPTANDTFFCAANPQVTVNIWTRIRVHVFTGVHGKVELFIQPQGQAETALVLTRDAGTGATSSNDVNTGSINAVKYDSTYNSGSSVTALMYQYVDDLSVYSGLAR